MYNMHRQLQSKHQAPRKLDRSNASRDIDYEATSLSPSTSFDASALHRSSFRVEGVDGEFDLICRSLGLSAEDFAIPASAWEARRSSSSFDRVSDVCNEIDNVCIDNVGVRIDDRDLEKIRVTESESFRVTDSIRGCGLSSTLECIDQLNNNPILGKYGVTDSYRDDDLSSKGEVKTRVTENGFTLDEHAVRVEGTYKLHDRYEVASELGNHYNLVELRVSDSDRNNYLSSNDEAENRVKENNNSEDGTSEVKANNGLNPAKFEDGVGRNNELENFDEASSEPGDHHNLVESRFTNSDSDNFSETFKLKLGVESHVNGFSLAKIKVRDMRGDGFGELNENPRELGSRTATYRKGISVRACRSSGGRIMVDRPPLLAPLPVMPPSQVTDCTISSSDLLRSFAPPNDEDTGSYQKEMTVEDTKEVERKIVGREDVDGEWLRDIIVVSESCSHTLEDKNEESNVTPEPLHLISSFRCKFNINSWQKGDFLGSGSFGTVHEGFTEDGIFFAVKEVSLLDPGDQAKQSIYQLEQEIFFLSQFQHENIVQYLGTEKDNDKLYIFLELVTKGSLASLYQKYNLQDSQVSAYTRQILSGLNYLHLRKVVHRDIKCANILVDANGYVKLADFGLAKATNLNDLKSCKGTAFWMAPEVVNRKTHGYGLAADIWSLGCTVLEMLTRRIPYSHLEGMQALFRIGKGEPPPIPSSLSSEARDFVSKCLQVIPDERPTAAQLLDHPFVKRSLPTFSAPASPFHNGRRS